MTCHLKTVSQNDLVHVQFCECGLVHLHLGLFSLRLPESDFNLLSHTLAHVETAMAKAKS